MGRCACLRGCMSVCVCAIACVCLLKLKLGKRKSSGPMTINAIHCHVAAPRLVERPLAGTFRSGKFHNSRNIPKRSEPVEPLESRNMQREWERICMCGDVNSESSFLKSTNPICISHPIAMSKASKFCSNCISLTELNCRISVESFVLQSLRRSALYQVFSSFVR